MVKAAKQLQMTADALAKIVGSFYLPPPDKGHRPFSLFRGQLTRLSEEVVRHTGVGMVSTNKRISYSALKRAPSAPQLPHLPLT
jgi:hypothetical protein